MDLKNCPFCGFDDIDVVTSQTMIIDTSPIQYKREAFCNDCFCAGPPKNTHKEAVEAWNERSESIINNN